MKRAYKGIAIAGALSVCLFIYLFYRSEKTLVNELVKMLFSEDSYLAIKSSIAKALPLTELIIYSLPGGLWVFCVTVLSRNFIVKIKGYEIEVVLIPILFAIGLEFLQLIHVTKGIFDPLDIILYLVLWMIAAWPYQHESKQDILSPFTMRGFMCVSCFFSVYLAHVIN